MYEEELEIHSTYLLKDDRQVMVVQLSESKTVPDGKPVQIARLMGIPRKRLSSMQVPKLRKLIVRRVA